MSGALTHLSLFSGIGGLDLAAEWAGMRTVGQCEIADYPHAILCKHWPDVPKWRDIRTLTKETFYERTGMGTVDVVSGGFPCQPFSVAGKQKGKGDDRYLWPELLRVIRELTPRWVVGENVPGILRIAAADVVKDLEREGYNVVVFDFEAAAVGALHRRERIAFVGYAEHNGLSADTIGRRDTTISERGEEGTIQTVQSEGTGRHKDHNDVAYACVEGLQGCEQYGPHLEAGRRTESSGTTSECRGTIDVRDTTSERLSNRIDIALGRSESKPEPQRPNWWSVEPDVGRVAHGVPNRVDRLKCLGNAVVPQQFYPIFKAIAEIEGVTK